MLRQFSSSRSRENVRRGSWTKLECCCWQDQSIILQARSLLFVPRAALPTRKPLAGSRS